MPTPAGPVVGGPDWTPDLPAVAKYVPKRTVVGAVDGYGVPVATFTEATHPSSDIVADLIADAVTWVEVRVNPVAGSCATYATRAASLYAAWAVEAGYPDNRDDLSNADTLLKQAIAARDDLDKANEAATGQDPEDPQAHLMPVYSFPSPDPYGDYLLY